ncbi:MAG: Uncharacterised protein [Oceanospirillaceae bacterium UBA2001]|nr:MAG: Uncharacterised protein [Oceanospirillaceae bacterium UBA2001]
MLKANGLKASMSRRGNCHDNACAESFFSLLKKERIRRRTYPTREAAKSDVFNYIGHSYRPISKKVSISLKTVPIGNESITIDVQTIGLKFKGGSFTKFRKRRMLTPQNAEKARVTNSLLISIYMSSR